MSNQGLNVELPFDEFSKLVKENEFLKEDNQRLEAKENFEIRQLLDTNKYLQKVVTQQYNELVRVYSEETDEFIPMRFVYSSFINKKFSDNINAPVDYKPLIASWGYKVLLITTSADSDYDRRGDYWILLYDPYDDSDYQYGVLSVAYGTCSGCDMLQACDTLQDLEDLRNELHSKIRWHDLAGTIHFLSKHDWQGDANLSEDFIKQAIDILSKKAKG